MLKEVQIIEREALSTYNFVRPSICLSVRHER